MRSRWLRGSVVGLVVATAPACSLVTDFDRFEAQGAGDDDDDTVDACLGDDPAARAANDRCAGATALLPGTTPGPYRTRVSACLNDDRPASCLAGSAPEAFFSLSLPVPRWLRVTATRADRRPLTVPHALTALDSCAPADEFACLPGADVDGWLVPGEYRFQFDVGTAAGQAFPPEVELGILVDPQDGCATLPAIEAPALGEEETLEASTLGAQDDFESLDAGSTPDHVYELSVSERGTYLIETYGFAAEDLAPTERNIEDSVLTVRAACRDGVAAVIAQNDDKDVDLGDLYSEVVVELAPGAVFLVVDGFGPGNVGSYGLRIARL